MTHIARTNAILKIFDPTAFPIPIPALPSKEETPVTKSSGAEVPNPKITKPITSGDI